MPIFFLPTNKRVICLSVFLVLVIVTLTYTILSPTSTPSSYEISSSQSDSPTLLTRLRSIFTSSDSQPAPTATPSPLTPGTGVYNISQGKHLGPTINQVIFDPLDVQVGDQLTITLFVNASTPADTITATLTTDSSLEKLTFTKSDADMDVDYETWTTDLKLTNPVLYQYILTVTSKSTQGSSSIVVAPRS